METRKRGERADFDPGWEFGSLPEDEVLRRGADLFDERMYWEAHEVWEEVWRRRKGQADRDFLKGIIQAAAGMWHATQGNYVAALSAALERAIEASRRAQETGQAPDLAMVRLGLGQGGKGS